jgi:PhzF family phenazine biosynthesis protein
MDKAKFYIADAFADEIFGGNPAGVVWLDKVEFPNEEYMRRLAAEFRYSETAFVRHASGEAPTVDVFETRYFTPVEEVDLCGHATIGSFFALFSDGIIRDGGSYINRTKAGELAISIEGGTIWMELGASRLLGAVDNRDELYGIMGGEWTIRCAGPDARADAVIVSTGLPDILMPVADERELASLNPDFAALAELSKRLNVIGVHAFTTGAEDGQIHTRNFGPLVGIDEEAATGTSSGALAYYLYERGLVSDGEEITFIQGESMGRPSKITARAGNKVFVGGRAVILAKGCLI